MTSDKKFLNAADVSEYMSISIPMAYKIIRKLNDELNAQGYLTVSGKISRQYFEQKVYGFVSMQRS
ncbi:MAG: LysR family transcriptional regulator [Clostridiaceae bacterium]|nr:LysR family transcriptional regulator [Clostridiaceae bacterium]